MIRMGPRRKRAGVKRSSIAVDVKDYARLQDMAEKHRPPLSVRYVIGHALREFLKSAKAADSIKITALRPSKR